VKTGESGIVIGVSIDEVRQIAPKKGQYKRRQPDNEMELAGNYKTVVDPCRHPLI
jgi:hypothetical protein